MPTVTQTIAASGADFTTPAGAASAFVAGTGVTSGDDRVYNITQNAAFDSRFRITANAGSANSWRLTVDPSVRHTGFYGTGARLAISTTVQNAIEDSVAALDGTVEWLEVTVSGSGKVAAGVEWSAAFSSGKTKTVRNCMLHDNGAHAASPFRTCGIGSTGTTDCPMNANIVVTNTLISKWKSGSTANAVGIASTGSGGTATVANCTVDDIDVTGGTSGTARGVVCRNDANKTYRNNVVTKVGTNTTTGTKTCFSGTGGTLVASNNASDDATAPGSGSLTSIVRGDNFNAADSGDYRPLNDSAPIFGVGADLGTSPAGVNLDLTGRDRDALGDSWSIGAYQLSAGGAVSPTIAITTPTAYRIYQRSAGAATVTVSGTYAGSVSGSPPSEIEVQIDGAGSWIDLNATIGAGTWSGSLSVSEGTRTLTARWANSTGTTASVSNVLVGDVYLIAGQSNADGRLTNDQSYTHASQKAAVFDPDDTAWRELVDPVSRTATDGTPWPLLATQFLADQGVPVGFINGAEGGTEIGQWWTTSAQTKWTAAKARVTASGVNALKAVLWDQGESDAISDLIEATYNSRLDGLAGDVQSTYGCALVVAQVGMTSGIDANDDLDAIRRAQTTAWGDNANVKVGPLGYDRAALHWESDAEGLTIAKRWWVALGNAYYGKSYGRGPRISSAVLGSGRTTLTVVFDRALKTGLTHATAPWTVSDSAGASTVSAVNYHGSNPNAVVLTLAAQPAGTAGTVTVTFATGNTGSNVVVPRSADITMPSGTAIDLPAEPFYSQSVGEPASISTTETTLERGQSGQTLHVHMAGATADSDTGDWTIAVGASSGSITAVNASDTDDPILTVTAPQASGTATLTHVPSQATTTITVQDTIAPNSPTGVAAGANTYAFTLSWNAVTPSAGEAITYDVRKNGSTVSTAQAGTTYAVTGAVGGDVYGVRAGDGTNHSAWSDITFAPGIDDVTAQQIIDEVIAGILASPANKLATDGSGRVTVGSMADGTITSSAIANDAITDAKIAVPAETAGRPTRVLAMLRRIWEKMAGGNKRVRNRATGAVSLRNESDNANLETWSQSTTGASGSEVDTETKGA